ncbi:hypothetical protein RchiOBHm_Chr5g0023701 [Rosa chinensis]|uniref:Uncharacterized protein n=1 Tax=Rosa chinensis TaxID=74649 RepID=A0A2P6Q851_ROSCH|nr:hypothetical protein RchiOBHm_Chr5g0023701 [Rosa chinensis]
MPWLVLLLINFLIVNAEEMIIEAKISSSSHSIPMTTCALQRGPVTACRRSERAHQGGGCEPNCP